MNLLQDITKHNFALVLLDEEGYLKKLRDMIKFVKKTKCKICFVCLSRPYKDVANNFKEEGIDIKRFFFIDTLSSYYGEHAKEKNCLFLPSPVNLASVNYALKEVLAKEKCKIIFFDTVSSLLIYQENSEIIKFTHNLVSEQQDTKKVFIVLKRNSIPEADIKILRADLEMFADKTIDI
ncbi:MAG: hypothetical protein V1660_03600 [archaeon]